MADYLGPSFQLADEIPFAEFEAEFGKGAGVGARTRPLLVKGAVRHWPAWENWSFERLADLCDAQGGMTATFQTGLTEQGATRKTLQLPVAPYLRDLGRASATAIEAEREQGGAHHALPALLPQARRERLAPGESFHLDWSRMNFTPDRLYLQQWDMLRRLPGVRRDFPLRRLWPGARMTWEYVFIGPADTLAGLHYDFPNNWFCQVRGVKEFILFEQSQTPHLSPAAKYDWGATLSDVDISRLDADGPMGPVRDRFAQARGFYARVEAGDALYIPRRTWHAVLAMQPSISVGIFGLTPLEVALGGSRAAVLDLLHHARLYRWGNCTCHLARAAAAGAAAA